MDRSTVVTVLGPTRVQVGDSDVPITALQARLLALVAARPATAVPRWRLLEAGWRESVDEAAAINSLQVRFSGLRRAVASAGGVDRIVVAERGGYRLGPGVVVDAVRLADVLGVARSLRRTGRVGEAVDLLAPVVPSGPGEPLADLIDDPDSAGIREELANLVGAAAEEMYGLLLDAGRHQEVIAGLAGVVGDDPTRERLVAIYCQALYLCDRQIDALAALAHHRRVMSDEYGVDQCDDLAALERQILNHDSSLRSVGAVVRGSMPHRTTSFIGRANEVDRLVAALATHRVVTLTGVGGVGKSRLAQQVAMAHAADFRDGVWWVDLADSEGATQVVNAAAEVLGVDLQGNPEFWPAVIERVGGRDMLLVFDNCEHVVVPAARMLDELTRRCPHVRLLLTSREALNLAGEHVQRVSPLETRSESGGTAAAVELFRDRAARWLDASTPDPRTDELIAGMCADLDGVPLAIELACAQLGIMSLAELKRDLRQHVVRWTGPGASVPRQRTLTGLVDWSFQLLTEPERVLMEQMSVFVAGFSRRSAQAVCSSPEEEVTAGLKLFADKSLLEVDRGREIRFRMLSPIRTFAWDRLSQRGPAVRAQVERAHALHFVELADSVSLQLAEAQDESELVALLHREQGNWSRAAEFLLAGHEPGDARSLLRLVAALGWYWELHGADAVARDLLTAALAQPGTDLVAPERVAALFAAVTVQEDLGRHDESAALANEALHLAEQVGEPRLLIEARLHHARLLARRSRPDESLAVLGDIEDLGSAPVRLQISYWANLAWALLELGRTDEAREGWTTTARLAREAGADRLLARTLSNLAYLELREQQPEQAIVLLEEARLRARGAGDDTSLSYIAINLGLAQLSVGDVPAARLALREGLALVEAGQLTALQAGCAVGLALCAEAEDDHATAATLVGAVDAVLAAGHFALDPVEEQLHRDCRERLRTALGAQQYERVARTGALVGLSAALRRAVPASAGPIPSGPGQRL